MENSQLKQKKFGPYEIKQVKIGSGQAVTVFKALNLDWNTDCCVKIVDKSDQIQMEQYEIEKQVSQELKWVFHKNLVRIYDIYETDKYNYIFQELCDFDLGRYKKQLDREEILDLITQVASGYIQLMELNIMHRDIKQDNILIKKDKNGQIIYKLADFGQSKKCDEVSNRMQTKNQQGTFAKKAPEISESDYSYLADIFSFGLVLLELYLNIQIDKMQHKNCLLEYLKIKSFIQIKEMNDENKQQFQKIKNIFEYNKDDEIIKIIDQLLKYKKEDRIGWQDLLKKAQAIKKINNTQGNIQSAPNQQQQQQQIVQNQQTHMQNTLNKQSALNQQQQQQQIVQIKQPPNINQLTKQIPTNQLNNCQVMGNGIPTQLNYKQDPQLSQQIPFGNKIKTDGQYQPQSNLPSQHQPQSNLPSQNQPKSNLPSYNQPQSNLPSKIRILQKPPVQNNSKIDQNPNVQNQIIQIQQNPQIIPKQFQQYQTLNKSFSQQQFYIQGTINRQPSNNIQYIQQHQQQQLYQQNYRAN